MMQHQGNVLKYVQSAPAWERCGRGFTTLPSKGGAHMGAKLRALTKAKIGTMTAVKQGFEQQG